MSAEGIFSDAHEVYLLVLDYKGAVSSKQWLATFATKALADGYVAAMADAPMPPLPRGKQHALAVVPV